MVHHSTSDLIGVPEALSNRRNLESEFRVMKSVALASRSPPLGLRKCRKDDSPSAHFVPGDLIWGSYCHAIRNSVIFCERNCNHSSRRPPPFVSSLCLCDCDNGCCRLARSSYRQWQPLEQTLPARTRSALEARSVILGSSSAQTLTFIVATTSHLHRPQIRFTHQEAVYAARSRSRR
jgi:hypothetical protein